MTKGLCCGRYLDCVSTMLWIDGYSLVGGFYLAVFSGAWPSVPWELLQGELDQ